jgi:signal transduction histidine kinase
VLDSLLVAGNAVIALAYLGVAAILVYLVHRIRVLNARAADLAQRQAGLCSDFDHELRVPLGLILAPAERMLADDEMNEDQRENLELIARAARMLLERVSGLLETSQLAPSEAHERAWSGEELERTLESVQAAREQAERATLVMTNFLNVVLHELSTPITALLLQIERLRGGGHGALTPRQTEILKRITNSSTRLTELVESLRAYTRVQRPGACCKRVVLDLNALVGEVVAELRPQAEQKGLALDFVASPTRLELVSDERLVHLIVVNLVVNAIKSTQQGAVEVRTWTSDCTHRVSVRDAGPGISAAEQVRIFAPFEQLEPCPENHTPGIGLGLALVREMARALRGRIELKSQIGVGSTFSVVLPRSVEAES